MSHSSVCHRTESLLRKTFCVLTKQKGPRAEELSLCSMFHDRRQGQSFLLAPSSLWHQKNIYIPYSCVMRDNSQSVFRWVISFDDENDTVMSFHRVKRELRAGTWPPLGHQNPQRFTPGFCTHRWEPLLRGQFAVTQWFGGCWCAFTLSCSNNFTGFSQEAWRRIIPLRMRGGWAVPWGNGNL